MEWEWGIRLVGLMGIWSWFLVIDLAIMRFGDAWGVIDDIVLGLTLLSFGTCLGAAIVRQRREIEAPAKAHDTNRELLLVVMLVWGGVIVTCWWASAANFGWLVVMGFGAFISTAVLMGFTNRVLGSTADSRSFGVCLTLVYALLTWFTFDQPRWVSLGGLVVLFPSCFYYPNPSRLIFRYNMELFLLGLEVMVGVILVPKMISIEPAAIFMLVSFGASCVIIFTRMSHSNAATITDKDHHSMLYLTISWGIVLGFELLSRYTLNGDASESIYYRVFVPTLTAVGVLGVAWSLEAQIRFPKFTFVICLLGFFSSFRCVLGYPIFNGLTAAIGCLLLLVGPIYARAGLVFTLVTLVELSITWSSFATPVIKDDPTRGVMIGSSIIFGLGAAACLAIILVHLTMKVLVQNQLNGD